MRKVATYNPIYNFYWEYDISKKDFEEKEIQFLKEFEKFTKYYQNKRQKEN
tara:strand:- start:583 stop:735 length:153 start_codon:yes stop_codon:yes gene_type:complete